MFNDNGWQDYLEIQQVNDGQFVVNFHGNCATVSLTAAAVDVCNTFYLASDHDYYQPLDNWELKHVPNQHGGDGHLEIPSGWVGSVDVLVDVLGRVFKLPVKVAQGQAS